MSYKLYILVRNDMDSLTPGKACAQVAHAANVFMANMSKALAFPNDLELDRHPDYDEYVKWGRRLYYGTTIVLSVTGKELGDLITKAIQAGYSTDIITDPEYPLRDGETTHYFPCETCGYIFAPENNEITAQLKLMK